MSSKQRHDDDDDNEEQAWESEVGLYDDQLREAVAAKIEEVNSLTNSGKAKQALPIALTDPPILAGDESIKDDMTTAVFKCMNSINATSIEGVIETLDTEQQDVLMQYIYKALGNNYESGKMLKWHGFLFKKCSYGAIVRSMTARHTV